MGSKFYSKRLVTRVYIHQRRRAKRPKTFKSVEAAKKWAEANKITSYELVNLKTEESKSMKVKVVPIEAAGKKESKTEKRINDAPAEASS